MKIRRFPKSFLHLPIAVLLNAALLISGSPAAELNVGGDKATLRWETQPDHDYRVFASTDLGSWTDATETLHAQGATLQAEFPHLRRQFFRIVDLTPTGGWIAAKTPDEQADIVANHESGLSLGIGTARDAEDRLGTVESVTVLTEQGESFYVEVDSSGRPSRLYSGGEMLIFQRFDDTDGTADCTYIDAAGEAELLHVEFPEGSVPSADNTTPVEGESGVSFARALKIAGVAVGAVGCAAAVIAATVGTGGLLIPLALMACGSVAINAAALFLPEDDPKFAVAAGILDSVGCIIDPNLLTKAISCTAMTIDTADALLGSYHQYTGAHHDAILHAELLNGMPEIAAGVWEIHSSTGGANRWVVSSNHSFLVEGYVFPKRWGHDGINVTFNPETSTNPLFDYTYSGQIVSPDRMEGSILIYGQYVSGSWYAVRSPTH